MKHLTFLTKFIKSKLPTFTETPYRADSGYIHDKGTTALDVIKFESNELGNVIQFSHLPKEVKNALKSIPVEDVVWITKSKNVAVRYGTPDRVHDLGKGAKILANDGDGGYLVLKKSGVNKLLTEL